MNIKSLKTRIHRAIDGFVNPIANVGGGANGIATNVLAGATYEFDRITLNQILLRAAYRGSWIVAKACDGPADDMTKGGIYPITQMSPDWWRDIDRNAVLLDLWPQICDWIRWGRLFGGAILVVWVDGQSPEKPLNIDSVGFGQILGFDVFDRWRLIPDLANRIKSPGRNRGLPEYYTTVSDGMGTPYIKIHHSRCFRFGSAPLPHWERLGNLMWDMSIVERIFRVITSFDSATYGAAQLTTKAHLRTLKIPGYYDLIGGNQTAFQALLKRVSEMRLLQSNEGFTVIDKEEELEHFTQAFSGFDDILQSLREQVCGAIEYPEVKLLGKSASGLNASDEWVLENYNNENHTRQKITLYHPVYRLYDLICRHTHGEGLPDDFDFDFNHLSRPNPERQANIATAKVGAVLSAYEAGLTTAKSALLDLKQLSSEIGLFTNVTDDDIKDSENAPPKLEMQAEL